MIGQAERRHIRRDFSILFEHPEGRSDSDESSESAFWFDLNLDQIIDAIVAGREEYRLAPFFTRRLVRVDEITYRHEIFRDLDGSPLFEHLTSFAQRMTEMRSALVLADKLRYKLQKQRWFLKAAETYCDAITRLAERVEVADVGSRGFKRFRSYLAGYASSDEFASLRADTAQLAKELSEVRYTLLIRGPRIHVARYELESDYSDEVATTFERFRGASEQGYRLPLDQRAAMNHVESGILDIVAQLYPEVFAALDRFCDLHREFFDRTIAVFDREVQFYLAYLEYLARFRSTGLLFAYPVVSEQSKDVFARDVFDLALAQRLTLEHAPVVCNDFDLTDPERIAVVSGPNQGGKTTFARTFGQLHYLAGLGLLVPASQAQLFLYDRMFTHFEKEEDLANLRGKLEDDLIRVREILEHATPNSIIIMNEIFTSTTLADAQFLGRQIMSRIIGLDLLCVCVTFVYELASLSKTAISLVSTVDREDPTLRTYKVVRRQADGTSYAASLADKYGLGYERLRVRLEG